jgi:peptide/nickel transport system substrate-binding protein
MARVHGFSRREMFAWGFKGALGMSGLSLLAACAPQAPSTPAKPTEPAKPADATKPAAPAATTAPAAAAKPAEAATPAEAAKPAAPAAAAAKPGAEPKLGAQLIGKLEGPTIITDPAQFPKSFKEAPMLTELVKAGTLPPVEQRVPQDPLVVKPVHEIGKYGGTWRRGFTGPGDKWNGWRAASGPDSILFWDYTGEKAVPNIAKDFKAEDGGKVLVLTLRRGMKWSDGTPFTADAFTCWFDDIYGNKDLVPSGHSLMSINGQPGKIEKGADELTVRYVFPEPYYLIADVLAGATQVSGHAFAGLNFLGSFAPGHYLKQYLPKYIGQDKADEMAKAAGFDNWVNHLKFKNDWALNPELPAVTPWVVKQPVNNQIWSFERNPYSIWVDTEGNQLPYMDKVQMALAENLEVLNVRAIAGEYDMQERHVDAGKIPVLLENQQKGNYKLYLDTGDYGADCYIRFNLSYEADPEIAKWLTNVDFRRAVSMGVDRDQLNETFWLGLGTPGSLVPIESNKYNPGPEWRTKWHTLDVKKSNELLDSIGLSKKDAEGFRLRTDNGQRLRIELQTRGGQFLQYTRIGEMIRDHWRKIGIDLIVQENERSLAERRNAGNESQMDAWVADGSEHMFTFPDQIFPSNTTSSGGILFARWYLSNGKEGKEPPPYLKEIYELFRKGFGLPEAERIPVGKRIWELVTDNVISFGIVGLSPAAQGIRVAKNNLGNVPSRQYNSPDGKSPGISRPVTFYFKS